MTLPKVPNNPTTNPDAPSATMYSGRNRLVIWNPRLNANIDSETTSTSRSKAKN
jgi:hypothetical protein